MFHPEKLQADEPDHENRSNDAEAYQCGVQVEQIGQFKADTKKNKKESSYEKGCLYRDHMKILQYRFQFFLPDPWS